MKSLTPVLFALMPLLPVSAYAATQVECHAMFRKADHNSDGSIGGVELLPFAPSLIAGGLPAESIQQLAIKAQEFEENCMRDHFKDVPLPQ